MNADRRHHLLETVGDNWGLRAELGEFITAPSDEQAVSLYLGQRRIEQKLDALIQLETKLDEISKKVQAPSKPLKERLYDMGLAGAVISYFLYDQGKLPPLR